MPCQFELNKRELHSSATCCLWSTGHCDRTDFFCFTAYSEPLWAALNQTRSIEFVQQADQLYRIGKMSGMQAHRPSAAYTLFFARPTAPTKWATTGRLRVLVAGADRAADGSPQINVSACLNGVKLQPTTNVSSQYDEGVQATLALWPPESWRAFDGE